MTKSEIMAKYIERAAHYDWEDVRLYIAECGWDSFWMPDYVTADEEDWLSDDDICRINDILLDAFEEAHGRRFDRRTRRELLSY